MMIWSTHPKLILLRPSYTDSPALNVNRSFESPGKRGVSALLGVKVGVGDERKLGSDMRGP